uniref:RRM domain-containing protein n=1 Tax=Aegilops tauschii subsp. strangulata TaxID=200361 RepID=A0A452YPF4_AEGTS
FIGSSLPEFFGGATRSLHALIAPALPQKIHFLKLALSRAHNDFFFKWQWIPRVLTAISRRVGSMWAIWILGYQRSDVIKMFSPYGKIIAEDFLLHTRGPKRGEPRGYAFVQYTTKE